MKNKIDYKTKYNKLKTKYENLKIRNNVLSMFQDISFDKKIKIIDDYYIWLSEHELDANQAQVYFEYRKHLESKTLGMR